MEMDSDSPLHGEMPDGAEVSPLAENQPEDVDGEISENNVSSLDAAAVEESATNGEPISSSDAFDVEPDALPAEEQPGPDQVNAEAEEEMDIDDSAADAEPEGEAEAEVDAEAAAEADAEADPDADADVDAEAEAAAQAETEESAYIGDNCLSTPAETEENSPQESQIDQIKEELDEAEEAGAEESPDQSISSAMPTDSGVGEGDEPKWKEEIQDDESSTMDEDMGGGEGVASSDDVNDISSAAQEALSSAAQEALSTAISSSTAESGADISSSGQSETALISSTANGPAVVHSFSLAPQLPQSNVFGDADTSEMEGAADTMPIVSESMPILTMSANSSAMLSPTFTQGEESSGGGVSSSVAGVGLVGASAAGAEAEGAVSSSGAAKGAPLPPTDAAHALATLASAALHHQHDQTEPEEPKLNDEDVWYTVGIVKGTSFTVQNYLSDPYVDLSSLSLDNLPDLSGMPTTPLEHGTAYKFRIAAFNSCGRGEFSEESAFKTCLPGFPGAPSAIKISKSVEGAHLSWEPPQVAAEGIFEYSVYLAVRSNSQPKEAAKSQLAFVRVYCGKSNTCVVAQSSLSAAHVDSSTKPAIIFRIAARNEKGYGPATQVRWLQDIKSTGVKRAGEGRLPGASPSKQPKQILH